MKLGIIGGSGLYDMNNMKDPREIKVETPFGQPSDALATGLFNNTEVVFLPRHGKGHRILPGEINHKANIFAMKKLGVTHIISISAVGSLKKEIKPRDIVIIDQYFDRTKRGLDQTFFGNGIVAHVGFADPVCPELKQIAYRAAVEAVDEIEHPYVKPKIHLGGTYINMEGPAFSTKAESRIYKSWGIDIIGMTNLAEAKLAREAEICYSTIAMVTDYDCWHPEHDHVTIDMIIKNFLANVGISKSIICKIIQLIECLEGKCHCRTALSSAIITSPDAITDDIKKRLAPIIGKYFPLSEK